MRAKHSILTVLSLGFVLLATLATSAKAAQHVPLSQAAMRVGGILCAPGAALAAEKRMLDAAIPQDQALPAAQTLDEDDYASGFWTQMPTPEELAPPQSAPPPAEMPAGSLPIVSAHYAQGTTDIYLPCGNSTVKNCTALPRAEVAAELMQPLPFAIEATSPNPQVLIVHTHATETYQLTPDPWYSPDFTARTTDMSLNMTSVGAAMAAELNAAGINTVQDTTLHDYPSYTASYARSNETVRKYLQQYPSIKVVLDVHRDAIQKDDGTRVKPVTEIDGKSVAQVMLICGANKNGNLPNCKQNLRFASRWQSEMEALYPGFTRPFLFDYRYYNQDLSTGSLLIEVGGHANTLEEATAAGVYAARALAKTLLG